MFLIIMSPGIALLIGTIILIGLLWIIWPRKGLYARWGKSSLNKKRVLMEDALKFIFDCEYKNHICTLNSVAGNMNISGDQATKVLDHLQSIGLVRLSNRQCRLTDAGRSYALQIIRVHRVWERYLADETGIHQMEWHGAADLMEHHLSSEDADQLAARIGNPVFDPHGDPIPTSMGEIPAHLGQPLSHLKEGDIGRIVHVEDEPLAIYEQLLALDLYPGTQVYIMDVTDDRIQFAANGEECILTPLFASNITVKTLVDHEPVQEKNRYLSSLAIGEKGIVTGISPKCRGQERRRLLDFGVIRGSEIKAELKSASGDPIAYRVMGATIAIRKKLADNIFINRIQTNHE